MAKRDNNTDEKKDFKPTDTPPQAGGGTPGPSKSDSGYGPLVQAAARVSTTYPVGAQVGGDICTINVRGSTSAPKIAYPTIPGYMAIDYIPSFGISRDPSSPLNRAMNYDFLAVRSKISGKREYEPVDSMLYRICILSLRDMYAKAKLIYTVMSKYSATNLYKPNAILQGLGVNPQDWMSHMSDLYFFLISNAQALKPYPAVRIGTISDRWTLFNSALFTDGESENSQVYIVNQKYYYTYENVDQVKGATLVAFPSTYDAFISMWNNALTALQNSTDVHVIAADIRRAYEDNILPELTPPAVDDKIEYVKSDSALLTIMNACLCGMNEPTGGEGSSPKYAEAFKYTDSGDGNIFCSGLLSGTDQNYEEYAAFGPAMPTHINLLSVNATSEDIARAVRMQPSVIYSHVQSQPSGESVSTANIDSCGTEIPLYVRIGLLSAVGSTVAEYILGGVNVWATQNLVTDQYVQVLHGETDISEALIAAMSALNHFDWHPPITIAYPSGERTSNYVSTEDIQVYVPLANSVRKQIHNAILLEAFGFTA